MDISKDLCAGDDLSVRSGYSALTHRLLVSRVQMPQALFTTALAAPSHDANEVDVKPVLVNGEILSSDPKSLEDDNVAVIQICGHTLHNTCLKEWTAKANSCPICRQNFNIVEVYDKIGGTQLSTYTVEDRKQVAEFDAQAIFDDYAENLDDEISTPCPVCGRDDHEEVLLLCDGCDTAYHTHCIGLESVPEGAWFCMECVTLFGEAVNQSDTQGPPAAGLGRNASRRTGTGRGRRDFFPRTRHSMRRVDRRARSDQWQGAWGQITGHVWDALNIDLDHDEDDALEEFRRIERRRDNERREFQRWQERLDIARRLGAQHIFERSIPSAILQHASRHGGPSHASSASARAQVATIQQSQEERRAWGDFERARDRDQPVQPNSRKRKSRSTTGSPVEPQPEPERRLKRPRTRRIGAPSEAGPSTSAPAERAPTSVSRVSVSAFSPVSASSPPAPTSPSPPAPPTVYPRRGTINTANIAAPSIRSPPPNADQPSFLSSLLKEVEMSTPADDENIRCLFGEAPHPAADPSSPVASSPAASTYSSPRAMSTTPPPHRTLRASSPTTLSSHILPVYPPANYSPTRSAASPGGAGAGGDNSDSDDHTRGGNTRNNHSNDNRRSPSAVEIRQPRPRRMPSVSTARSPETSPSRHSLSLEMKENISSIVRSALNPHWKSSQLTADQYAAINRDVSRKLYEEVSNPVVVGSEMRRIWEQKASREVARAVAELQA
ncbi:phd and ring finger domain protein [Ophiostoma piceae UAMH 11346]|uniref:Phd and ring finger domain protein n=1 Tax=Ophiostoma piceae (strain UAMH 11346) TaxID=1262450 RepID=S3CBS5_OPHP1|nr:phd and ring finger domain protein [Ophiostoma piceae UAMH 11346]